MVNDLLRNPVYYGHRRKGGNLEVEALVPFAVWQEANAMIDGRKRQRGGASKHPPALLKPVCLACYGVEHDGCRNNVGIAYLNRYPDGHLAYKCVGSGPQRRGCGARLIPAEVLDVMVLERFSSSPLPHVTRTFVPGRDVALELPDLNQQISEAMAKGDYGLVGRLSEKAEEVRKAEGTRGRWVSEPNGTVRAGEFIFSDDDGDSGILDMWKLEGNGINR